jgi:hypothetical protein
MLSVSQRPTPSKNLYVGCAVKDLPRDLCEKTVNNGRQSFEDEERETCTHSDKEGELSSTGSDVLTNSLLVVFRRAGDTGLTAREAVSKLKEYDLPGLQEGSGERSSVQVAKVLKTPTFVHLEGGKYFLYPTTPKAIPAESSSLSDQPQEQNPNSQPRDQEEGGGNIPLFTSSRRKRHRHKAPTSSASEVTTTGGGGGSNIKPGKNLNALLAAEKIEFKKRRRRPPSSQHELAIGPTQCKRYDGRGWQCTRETEEGFSFCEHHQALMNKRTLRLSLAKKRVTNTVTDKKVLDMELTKKDLAAVVVAADGSRGSSNQGMMMAEKPDGALNLVQYQRRRMVKARSLKSIK